MTKIEINSFPCLCYTPQHAVACDLYGVFVVFLHMDKRIVGQNRIPEQWRGK